MLAWKLCTSAAAAFLLAATAARADDGPVIVVTPPQADSGEAGAGGLGKALIDDVAWRRGPAATRADYWIGLFASPPSPALQAQLSLPKDQGLLVESLRPESPAAKAGVKQYDVLLKGNGKPLSAVDDLVKLISQVKEGKLTLELLHAGKHETVIVTPAKRPAGEMEGLWIFEPQGAVARSLSGSLGLGEGGPLEFRIVHPGQILPPPGSPAKGGPGGATMEIVVRATSKLADGSQVEITRHGMEPAAVVVTHDKDKWKGTANDLSKIPEKLRPEVEKLLHPAFDQMRVLATTGGVGGFGLSGGMPGGPRFSAVSPEVEKRLGELQKQVAELRRSVEALQGKK